MLKTISLFSGIGGLDFGFEEAGFETRVALELETTPARDAPEPALMEGH